MNEMMKMFVEYLNKEVVGDFHRVTNQGSVVFTDAEFLKLKESSIFKWDQFRTYESPTSIGIRDVSGERGYAYVTEMGPDSVAVTFYSLTEEFEENWNIYTVLVPFFRQAKMTRVLPNLGDRINVAGRWFYRVRDMIEQAKMIAILGSCACPVYCDYSQAAWIYIPESPFANPVLINRETMMKVLEQMDSVK